MILGDAMTLEPQMKFQAAALETIEIEAKAVSALKDIIDDKFIAACELLYRCEGRVVVIGMGKSGHIGAKIAATLASTGRPAFYVNAAEAGHGDLGMITKADVALVLSFSGKTPEVLGLLPRIASLEVPIISLTGALDSPLAKASTIALIIPIEKEACPLNLAPTASTTASLALGDALAIALLTERGFTAEDFAFSHPSGNLGKQLLLKVSNLMHAGASMPQIPPNTSLRSAIQEMSRKGLGLVLIVDEETQLLGVFSDGDLRRLCEEGPLNFEDNIQQFMRQKPKSITPNELAGKALEVMERYKITSLPVIEDSGKKLLGLLHMHDILQGILEPSRIPLRRS